MSCVSATTRSHFFLTLFLSYYKSKVLVQARSVTCVGYRKCLLDVTTARETTHSAWQLVCVLLAVETTLGFVRGSFMSARSFLISYLIL